MGTDDGLSKKIELLREELNRSLTSREDLQKSYDKSVELDKLMEQYIKEKQQKGKENKDK